MNTLPHSTVERSANEPSKENGKMLETPVTVGGLEALQAMIQERILEHTGARVHGLRLGTLSDRIVVSGAAPTHELQLAVMAAIRESVYDHLIGDGRAVPVCMHVELSASGTTHTGGRQP